MNFFREADRLSSFEKWPVPLMDPRKLAAAGFYFLNQSNDTVRCAFCGVEIGKWEQDDDPFVDHRKWSGNCKFVKKLPCGNVPLDPSNDTALFTGAGHDDHRSFGIELKRKVTESEYPPTKHNDVPPLEKLSVQKKESPMFPKYATLKARLSSYILWPISLKIKPEMLAHAGLFYLGKGDHVMCFHCGLGLQDWRDDDDPWTEHALWAGRCNWVLSVKGKEFVSRIVRKEKSLRTFPFRKQSLESMLAAKSLRALTVEPQPTESGDKSIVFKSSTSQSSGPKVPPSETSTSNCRECKICFTEEISVVFLPCGHTMACIECAQSLDRCPVCRKSCLATARVYLP
nr:PREDICTED: putative inhibitor of apoptosis [Bemisia tabaci]